jgi:hypothetical protein
VAIQWRIKTRAIRIMLTAEPASTPKGAWARLVNLGYVSLDQPPAEPDGDQLRQALFVYQSRRGLRRSGVLDVDTQEHLENDSFTS